MMIESGKSPSAASRFPAVAQLRFLLYVLLAVSLSGCSLQNIYPYEICTSDKGDCLMAASYQAIDEMIASIPAGKRLPQDRPLLVATLVNIDTLSGSRFGRTVSEHLGTRLTRHGFRVIEMKLRETIFVKQAEGELMLSREIREIGRSHEAQAVVVGTYSESRGRVYVTVKIVGAADGVVIAAHDYLLPVDSNVRALLWPNPR